MPYLEVMPFVEDAAETWDAFVAHSFYGTLLHSWRFLSYHGSRFHDQSLVILRNGRWVGVIPAARHPSDDTIVVSHPGTTYGGILHQGALMGGAMISAFEAVTSHYRSRGFRRFVYKAVPVVYHRIPAMDDLYALFRLGAAMTRCDLSSAIDLSTRRSPNKRRCRALRKALSADLEIRSELEFLPALWGVLTDALASRHGVRPAHTLEEITLLAQRFPDDIRLMTAHRTGRVVAGVVLFITPMCAHTQYVAANHEGFVHQALDIVFERAIEQAREEGRRWFDFGISTEEGGHLLNEGLYRFKSEFGGGGVIHEFYDLILESGNHVA